MNTDRENYGNNNNTNNKMWYNNFNIVWEKSNLGEFCLPFMFLMKIVSTCQTDKDRGC